jgi:hypothetical protein
MDFDLVHGRDDRSVREQALQVLRHEVTYADGAHFPITEQHRIPWRGAGLSLDPVRAITA